MPVRRFPRRVTHEIRSAFGRRSQHVFEHRIRSPMSSTGSTRKGRPAPALVRHVARHAASYDFCLFFSYRYFHAYHGARAAADRAVLVPTAERDEAIGLTVFQSIFRGVRALMYNSPEERAMIQAVSAQPGCAGRRRRRRFGRAAEPAAASLSRRSSTSGGHSPSTSGGSTRTRAAQSSSGFSSATCGRQAAACRWCWSATRCCPIPTHPRIRHLGFVDDTDKFDAMAAAELLIMPSYFESLSMVALEAWALGRPVLANGRCDVLKAQCLRSNAGLYYESEAEFVEGLCALERNRWLAGSLGRNGRQFFKDHYDWPVIERKYLDMFDAASPRMEAAPDGAAAAARLRAGLAGPMRSRREQVRCARRS